MRTVRLPIVALVAILSSAPAFAQSRMYTNADLGRPLARTATATPEQLASMAARQFRLPPSYPPEPQVVIIGHPEDGPFGSFGPFREFPPTAPLFNDPYYYGPSVLYGGPFFSSGPRRKSSFIPPLPSQIRPLAPQSSRRGGGANRRR